MRLYTRSRALSEPVRTNVVGLLNSRLADCIDLQTQTKQVPCILQGQNCSLYRLFDDINQEVEQNVDNIAHRAEQLGGTAEPTACPLSLISSLPEYPSSLISGRDQVTALADALASFRKNVRQAIGWTCRRMRRRGIDSWLL